jgi:cell division protein FtsQ
MAPKAYLGEDGSAPGPRGRALRGEPRDAAAGIGAGGEELNAPMLDLEPSADSQFLRVQKPVPVRRGPLPRRAANRLKQLLVALLVLGAGVTVLAAAAEYGRRSWRFRLDSSDDIQLTGNRNVSRAQIVEVFGADISRNVFLIPLEERKLQLEKIPWVESATVMRLLPDGLRVELRERVPVAYVQVGTEIKLGDREGVLMDVPAGMHYSFPVILGFNAADPPPARASRMQKYAALMRDLDSGGAAYSHDVSEVDLADPEDVKVLVADPEGEVLIHLGGSSFMERYRIYVTQAQSWRRQFQKLDSVDLRYDGQVIVNPDAGVRRGP